MRYYIKQKVFSIGDKFDIFDENQNPVYHVEGKFFSISNKLRFLDVNDGEILNAKRKILSFFPTYYMYDESGTEVAMIRKKISFLGSKFVFNFKGKPMMITGNLFAHDFSIEDEGMSIVSVQKKYISWGDTYEINIDESHDTELFLFAVVILDQILHEGSKSRN